MIYSRRGFLRRSCCTAAALGLASSFSRFGLINALAQSSSEYRALVCVFLFGGNDANNMLIPNDSAGYANYNSIRNPGGLALAQNTLLPITAKTNQQVGSILSNQFGLHPNLPDLQNLFNTNRLAFLANVGTLPQPITRAQYQGNTVPLPANLFSHSDQQQEWQTSGLTELDSFARSGWAGRMADQVQSLNVNSSFPPITSVAGSAIFCTGQQTQPFAIIPSATGTTPPGLTDTNQARLTALNQLLTFDTGISLIQSASTVSTNALADSKAISGALSGVGALQTQFPSTSIGLQLQQVAKLLQIRSNLGLMRQIFFCSLGGFDTHSNQISTQQTLYSQLSSAVAAFYNATVELGLDQQVTTFTLSDFSRTYQPASDGGTDHAWGTVQLIVGGGVLGGDIYGTLPQFALGGPNDVGSNGRWIPTTSVDQYGATLGTWFGVQAAQLPSVFPNLPNFSTSNLGFLG